MSDWMELLELYSDTSVTESSDRLVAIAGLANRLKTLYKEPFRGLVYHSGIWSTDIARQLLWGGDTNGILPKSRFRSATHPIPSWSPLSYGGKITMPHRKSRGRGFLPVGFKGISDPDDLGRSKNQTEAMLHLSGVLVPMKIHIGLAYSDTPDYHTMRAHPEGYPDVVMEICWDNMEDMEKAKASSATGQPISLRALICVYDPERFVQASGILLMPWSLGSQQIKSTQNWVRCGYIKLLEPYDEEFKYVDPRRVRTALAFESYGKGYEVKTSEEEPGTCPHRSQIEDIYIY